MKTKKLSPLVVGIIALGVASVGAFIGYTHITQSDAFLDTYTYAEIEERIIKAQTKSYKELREAIDEEIKKTQNVSGNTSLRGNISSMILGVPKIEFDITGYGLQHTDNHVDFSIQDLGAKVSTDIAGTKEDYSFAAKNMHLIFNKEGLYLYMEDLDVSIPIFVDPIIVSAVQEAFDEKGYLAIPLDYLGLEDFHNTQFEDIVQEIADEFGLYISENSLLAVTGQEGSVYELGLREDICVFTSGIEEKIKQFEAQENFYIYKDGAFNTNITQDEFCVESIQRLNTNIDIHMQMGRFSGEILVQTMIDERYIANMKIRIHAKENNSSFMLTDMQAGEEEDPIVQIYHEKGKLHGTILYTNEEHALNASITPEGKTDILYSYSGHDGDINLTATGTISDEIDLGGNIKVDSVEGISVESPLKIQKTKNRNNDIFLFEAQPKITNDQSLPTFEDTQGEIKLSSSYDKRNSGATGNIDILVNFENLLNIELAIQEEYLYNSSLTTDFASPENTFSPEFLEQKIGEKILKEEGEEKVAQNL